MEGEWVKEMKYWVYVSWFSKVVLITVYYLLVSLRALTSVIHASKFPGNILVHRNVISS